MYKVLDELENSKLVTELFNLNVTIDNYIGELLPNVSSVKKEILKEIYGQSSEFLEGFMYSDDEYLTFDWINKNEAYNLELEVTKETCTLSNYDFSNLKDDFKLAKLTIDAIQTINRLSRIDIEEIKEIDDLYDLDMQEPEIQAIDNMTKECNLNIYDLILELKNIINEIGLKSFDVLYNKFKLIDRHMESLKNDLMLIEKKDWSKVLNGYFKII